MATIVVGNIPLPQAKQIFYREPKLFRSQSHYADALLRKFHPYLNKAFTALTDGNPYFILIEARPLASPPSSGMIRAPFSLLFRNALPILFMQKSIAFSIRQ